jgi:hypothetical protein
MSNWPLEKPPGLPAPAIPKRKAPKLASPKIAIQQGRELINLAI